MTHSDYLGLGTRLTSGPSALLVQTGFATETGQAQHLNPWMAIADITHVLAMRDAGVLPSEVDQRLLAALHDLMKTPPEDLAFDPAHGDVYNNREHLLRARVGDDAGWLSLGRTRREAGRTAFYLAARAGLLDMHDSVSRFVDVAARRALDNIDAYWADLTYWQPAQVSTFGHYLLSFAHESARHLERIRHAWERCALIPVAAGGVAGTSVPVSRSAYLTRLGLTGSATTSRDAMWSVDGLLDLAIVAEQVSLTASRLAEDFMLFATAPFGYVRLHDSHCRASVYLPQKRNPYALAVVRGGAGLMTGRVTGVMTSVRTASAQSDNWIYNYGEILDMLRAASDVCALMTEVLERAEFDSAKMFEQALEGYTEAADLAEQLVAGGHIDYRSAHSLVAELASAAEGRGQSRLTQDDYRMLTQRTGTAQAASDPRALVAARASEGSASPTQVRASARRLRRQLTQRRRWGERAKSAADAAVRDLLLESEGPR